MQFFELTHPAYKTDAEDDFYNPVRIVEDIKLPGLSCTACGATWAGSRRLYLPVRDAALRKRLSGPPLPEEEWKRLADAVRQDAELPQSFELMPGDVLGTPTVELLGSLTPDFMHPFPGQLVVQGNVVKALEYAGLTGFQPIRMEVRWSKNLGQVPESPPELYELLVTGRAWRVGVDKDSIVVCHHCGRSIFPWAQWVIDEDRWDRTDFFNVDENPNIVVVTGRVCDILSEHHFRNWECVPIDAGV